MPINCNLKELITILALAYYAYADEHHVHSTPYSIKLNNSCYSTCFDWSAPLEVTWRRDGYNCRTSYAFNPVKLNNSCLPASTDRRPSQWHGDATAIISGQLFAAHYWTGWAFCRAVHCCLCCYRSLSHQLWDWIMNYHYFAALINKIAVTLCMLFWLSCVTSK